MTINTSVSVAKAGKLISIIFYIWFFLLKFRAQVAWKLSKCFCGTNTAHLVFFLPQKTYACTKMKSIKCVLLEGFLYFYMFRYSTMSSWLFSFASSFGVFPSPVLLLVLAPFSTRNLTISRWPFLLDICKGVHRFSFTEF